MATFRAEGSCTLTTYIEADGTLELHSDDVVADFDDDTSSESQRVEQEAQFSFTVTASDEDDAQEKAEEALNDLSYSTYNVEWEIEDSEIHNVTRTSPEMTPEEAIQVLSDWADGSDDLAVDVKEAIGVLLDTVPALLRDVAALQAAVAIQATPQPFEPGEAPDGIAPAKPGEEINPDWS